MGRVRMEGAVFIANDILNDPCFVILVIYNGELADGVNDC